MTARRRDYQRPGHFICADRCKFFRHTHVGRYCVSTVGDMHLTPDGPREEIGWRRFFETMVFDLKARGGVRWREKDASSYNDAHAAELGHEAMVKKWRPAK